MKNKPAHELRFDSRLYSKKAVEAAAEAYADAAPLAVREADGLIIVAVGAPREKLDEEFDGDFAGEFANHALWEMSA